MRQLLKEYRLGDMAVRYETDEKRHVGLTLYPADKPLSTVEKQAALDSLVQLKLAGDAAEGCYAQGNTMRNSASVQNMRYVSQNTKEDAFGTEIVTILADSRGYEVHHHLYWKREMPYISVFCEFHNHGQDPAQLELLSSFSIERISPYLEGDCHERLYIHRLRSRWSQEGSLESLPAESLQLDASWNRDSVKCERFGQVGSLPVNNFFPWLLVEDTQSGVFWGAQLYHGASWQIELFRKDENFAVSGGLADREFGHWKKNVAPGESFCSPKAVLTVCEADSLDLASDRLVKAQEEGLESLPAQEQELPLIFNEYCTTWGCPSQENIVKILDALKGKGFTYFVIDCGWYKEDGVPWDVSMGDYQVSNALFPDGMEETVSAIRKAGFKPGIWFEFENVGPASKAYQYTAHLLKRDGFVLTTGRRRFWDMNDPWVTAYLDERLIGMLKRYGFAYLKVDYNDTIGIGCDGWESQGEGLRRNIEATQAYFRKIARQIPGIVIENCASGGHRLEPGFMALSSMASFSDAHECEEIPIIAANLHRAILPRQSQIWAVIRKTDSLKRIAYSMAAAFLGRLCLSGDVTELSSEQWRMVDAGIAFYKKIAPVIKDGTSLRYGPKIACIRHPRGWQCVFRNGRDNRGFAVIHTFDGELPHTIEIPLPDGGPYRIEEVYSDTQEAVRVQDGVLLYEPSENRRAVAVLVSSASGKV